MRAKYNINLNKINSLSEQSLDSFPHKSNEESLNTIQKVCGIELIKKASDEIQDDEPKRSKPEDNEEEEEEFNYLNEDNFPFPSGNDDENNSPSSEKIDKIADNLDHIRQNDEQKDQKLLARKTARKKSDDCSSVEKIKKNFFEKSL